MLSSVEVIRYLEQGMLLKEETTEVLQIDSKLVRTSLLCHELGEFLLTKPLVEDVIDQVLLLAHLLCKVVIEGVRIPRVKTDLGHFHCYPK